MRANDVMSSPVISIGPQLPVRDIAALLVRHRIGGLPVMAGGRLIGMVTESDLLHRHEIGTDDDSDPRSWWRRMLDSDPLPAQYIKSHGNCAQYVMTAPVVSVAPATSLSEIAAIFDAKGIGRVPVLADEQVIGIVTCADMLKPMATNRGPQRTEARSDASIREHLHAELTRQAWWNPGWSELFVTNGVVEFKGVVETEALRLAARVAAENIAGVIAVRDHRILGSRLASTMM